MARGTSTLSPSRSRGVQRHPTTVTVSDGTVVPSTGLTDFVKLRSVSLSYRLPQRFSFTNGGTTTLTLAGRNLFTWTNYDGVDPESSDQSDAGTGLGRREYYQLPPYRTFLATLRLTF